MERQGVEVRLWQADRSVQEQLVAEIVRFSPDLTCAFNGLFPSADGRFLADILDIPHLACLVDSPHQFLPLVRSARSILACDDAHSVESFAAMGKAEAFFFPHAVELDAFESPARERTVDVLFTGSLYPPDLIQEEWHRDYPAAVAERMDSLAASMVESDEGYAADTLMAALNDWGEPLSQAQVLGLIDLLERYIRGWDRLALIRALDGLAVHVYGAHPEGASWADRLQGLGHVHVHPSVGYLEAMHLMRQAKVVLHSCPRVRFGGHERLFSALACGAAVLCQWNRYLAADYTEGESLVFYRSSQRARAADTLRELLANEAKRQALVEAGQDITRRKHSWEQRAQMLCSMPSLLSRS
jgi:glycosyltransferase involved in cell wall biosynthesis